MAKDYLGVPLSVGDKVIFVELGYRNLLQGTVTRLTPKMVFIKHLYGHGCGDHTRETKQTHSQVIRTETPRVAELVPGYWDNCPEYPLEDWMQEVGNGDTRRSYWDWVDASKERDLGENV